MPLSLIPCNLRRCAFSAATGLLALILLSLATPAVAQQPKSEKPARTADSAQIARGKYIVDNVAMCGTCHTPHDSAGVADRGHYLEGAPLWLNPTMPITNWPLRAPRLAGQPSGSDAEVTTLLTTGLWKDGKPLRAPMPQFRMTREDADAVVAYLRSLNPGAP
jgi:mono/diheme cytochrome c family protein